jgi:hypothetical protein
MDWIKKNYGLFCLIIFAVVLLGISALLALNASSFSQNFESLKTTVAPNNKIPAVDLSVVESANAAVGAPKTWAPKEGSGLLFVSRKYMVKDGALYDPLDESSGIMLHPPVPNKWLSAQNLDLADNDVLNQDPDKDGFTNLDEWKGADPANPGSKSTNPNDPNSHPAYLTKLKLKRCIKKAFRLLFDAYDGEPDKPESMSFQINTLDLHQPSQFLRMNEMIAGTRFKIVKFVFKKTTDDNGVDHDVSELTLENTETKEQITLVKEKPGDSPDSFAQFHYAWDGSEPVVKKEKTFSLKPEIDVQYKLIDIQEGEALIENLKTHTKHKIPRE